MENDQDRPESALEASPNTTEKLVRHAQIPLLDDVVLNTELPFPKPKSPLGSAVKAAVQRQETQIPEHAPRPTDLFGGSPETAQAGPLSPHYSATDLDEAAQKMRQDTEQVVDNLVAEYSQEIVARLRNELTSLLDDLNQTEPPNDEPDPS